MMGETKLQAMWFAAGTAAFMACVERAMLVSFVEQWRAVVFLALNLILLAILFTSPSSPPTSANDVEPTSLECPGSMDLDENEEVMKKRKEFCSREDDRHDGDGVGSPGSGSKLVKGRIRNRESKDAGESEVAKDKANELSKEEFNERVEAFIATFRQHLVSDARGKSCRLHSSSTGNINHHRHGGIALRF